MKECVQDPLPCALKKQTLIDIFLSRDISFSWQSLALDISFSCHLFFWCLLLMSAVSLDISFSCHLFNRTSLSLASSSLGISFFFFPTCQVRVVRFYQSCSPPPPPPPLPPPPPHPPPPPRSPDPSGHSRTSTASSRSQWALPDLNRELQIAVGTAGPQPRLPGRSGHCRTSTATSRSQWALPDLNEKNVRKDVR